MPDSDVSRTDLFALLVETRSAIDVLFEMMAFDRADGEEEEYRQYLNALRARHERAVEQYWAERGMDRPDRATVPSLNHEEGTEDGAGRGE